MADVSESTTHHRRLPRQPDGAPRRARPVRRDVPARVDPRRARDDPGEPGRPRRRLRSSGCTTTCTRPTTGTSRSAGRASCCTTCASAARPTARPKCSTSAPAPTARTTTRACSSRPASRTASRSLTDMTITYLVDGYYNAADELGVAWDDPEIAADWGVTDPVLSDRDRANPKRAEIPERRPTRLAAAHMNLLVTGGAGFIGSNFVRYWARRASRATRSSSSTRSRTRATARTSPACRTSSCTPTSATSTSMERRLRDHAIDVIVNFAAESHNSYAITNPGVVLPHERRRHADACARRRGGSASHGFHHISTCEVYGDLASTRDEPFTESSPYRPRTPYNASKAGGDHAVRAYYETFGLPITITNCANNYGPYQFPEKVIPLFATRALDDQSLPLYASTQNRREWIHVARPLPRDRGGARATAGSARRTTSAPASSAASRRSPTACSPRSASRRR